MKTITLNFSDGESAAVDFEDGVYEDALTDFFDKISLGENLWYVGDFGATIIRAMEFHKVDFINMRHIISFCHN